MKHISIFTSLFIMLLAFMASAPAQEYTSEKDIQEKSADDWRDFQIQGEYVFADGPAVFAVQVLADGGGKFTLVGHPGGFPGQGWIEKQVRITFKGEIDGDFVNFKPVFMQNKEDYRKELEIPEGSKANTAKLNIAEKTISFESPGKPARVAKRFDKRVSPTLGAEPPEGAVVFYDGVRGCTCTEMIVNDHGVNEETGALWPDMKTQPLEFGKTCKIHVEFMLSFMPNARGQGRSNSGVYLDENYECQVLDSFALHGESDECGGFYQVARPKFNACFSPLKWQTYDFDFTPAKFEDGKKVSNARVTVWHNGIKIHDDLEIPGSTGGGVGENGDPHGVYFQGHGNKVQYRNIWIKYE